MGILDGEYSFARDVYGDGKVIEVRSGIRRIPDDAFKGETAIEEITLPGTVLEIGAGAFRRCTSLKSVFLPMSLVTLGSEAFAGCSSLESVTLPRSVESIGRMAFQGCKSLKGISTPPGGRYVSRGEYLYDTKDSALVRYLPGAAAETVVLGREVERILDGAFEGCSRLTTVEHEAEYIDMGPFAFWRCPNLMFVGKKFTVRSRDRSSLVFCPPNTPMSSLKDPSLKSIGPMAFLGCTSVNEVVITRGLEFVDETAFVNFPGLRTVSIEKGASCTLPLVLYAKDGTRLKGSAAAGKTFTSRDGYIFRYAGEYDPVPDKPVPPAGTSPGTKDGGEAEEDRPRSRSDKFKPVSVEGCTLDDVCGLESVKAEFRNRLILPVERSELFDEYGLETSTGVLMYGPPGNGKTLMARAVAGELGAALFSITPSDIYSKWVGDEEKNVRALFKAARAHERSIIFFDDFDAIGKTRGRTDEPWLDSLVAELLIQMQGLEKHDGTLIVLAATNRPWVLDSALMRAGRFSVKIHVPLPDAEAREGIFRHDLDEVPHWDLDYARLAAETEGYSGADIADICGKAKMARVLEIAAGGRKGLGMKDVERVIAAVPPSVDPRDLEAIAAYEQSGESPAEDDGWSTLFKPVAVEGCSLADVSGLEDVKTEVRNRVVLPAENPGLFEKYGLEASDGVLMYGPPGNGKTLLARAIAGEMDAAFFSVSPSDIISKWVGNCERNIRNLFRAARRHERSIIFFDDFDAIGRQRGNELQPWMDNLIPEILVQMQGLERHKGTLIVLAATNRPWVLDPALMRSGRFSTKIYVPLPDLKAREGIFEHSLGAVPRSGLDFAALAEGTEGYSGADIAQICERAKLSRAVKAASGGKPEVDGSDIEEAMRASSPTVCRQDLEDMERYRLTGEGPSRGDGRDVYVPRNPAKGHRDAGYQ